MNLRMIEKCQSGEALDVSACDRTPEGDYLLRGALAAAAAAGDGETDFCDLRTEQWIWSIGRGPDGEVVASTSTKYYLREGWTCLFLR